MNYNKDYIFDILEEVKDPELPLLSINDMGILRDVVFNKINDEVSVIITPTYSGCPAMRVIEEDIVTFLNAKGYDKVKVNMVFSPAWTTDWMSDKAKNGLKQMGIAPPIGKSDDNIFTILETQRQLDCPFCNSNNTIKKAEFSATACKALYYCNSCQQAFEHFKCH
ncbi:MAG: phenylacetate-CoA oxygenase subunit PaaJ [Candidatus Kapabacteria bacterium]|nr:phenylacetate-CoA oxygenase subunit PaaJ [Candidatus Kapabacteria bacterium]